MLKTSATKSSFYVWQVYLTFWIFKMTIFFLVSTLVSITIYFSLFFMCQWWQSPCRSMYPIKHIEFVNFEIQGNDETRADNSIDFVIQLCSTFQDMYTICHVMICILMLTKSFQPLKSYIENFKCCVSFASRYTSLQSYEPHHEKTCLCHKRTTKVQISLRIHTVWSASLLFAAEIV